MKVYLGLGTNLGDKEKNLQDAVNEINKRVGKVTSLSAFYETAPWGFESENSFINAACEIETSCSPLEVLSKTQEIERDLGRIKKSVNGIYSDRLIDIDILLYEDMIMESTELTIPHPLMLKRDFVMNPLLDIASEVIHPVLKKKLKDLYPQSDECVIGEC